LGGKFQVANKPDFSDSITVYSISNTPEICYNRVDLHLQETYRYFRFLAPRGSFGGDIAELKVYDNEVTSKLQGTITGNADCRTGWTHRRPQSVKERDLFSGRSNNNFWDKRIQAKDNNSI
jgi:hypothetical protein